MKVHKNVQNPSEVLACEDGLVTLDSEKLPSVIDEGLVALGSEKLPSVVDEGTMALGSEKLPSVVDEGTMALGSEKLTSVVDEGFATLDSVELESARAAELALLSRAKSGDGDAIEQLVLQYQPLIQMRAAAFERTGLERQDLTQEGLLALLSAMRAYSPHKGAGFHTFVQVCVNNRLRNVAAAFMRSKNAPMRDARSLDQQPELLSTMHTPSPESLVIAREEAFQRRHLLDGLLTDMEYTVLRGYVGGKSYDVISTELGCSKKAVDNALQRIRKKVRTQLPSAFHR